MSTLSVNIDQLTFNENSPSYPHRLKYIQFKKKTSLKYENKEIGKMLRKYPILRIKTYSKKNKRPIVKLFFYPSVPVLSVHWFSGGPQIAQSSCTFSWWFLFSWAAKMTHANILFFHGSLPLFFQRFCFVSYNKQQTHLRD